MLADAIFSGLISGVLGYLCAPLLGLERRWPLALATCVVGMIVNLIAAVT